MDLKNHPGKFLNNPAGSALERAEKAAGHAFAISSAGRYESEQQGLINRWYKGGAANRPPFLFKPFEPASQSPHVKNGGEAIDVTDPADRNWLKAHPEFGFVFNVPSDYVHAIYVAANDKYRNGGTPTTGSQVTINRQAFLNGRGWKLKVDGIEGPATKKAYMEYQTFLQKNYGYNARIDGIWGPAMQAAHVKFVATLTPAKPPVSKNSINAPRGSTEWYKQVQTALNRHGAKLEVDGDWGPKSSKALALFQAKNGLKVDRLVGPKTEAKLEA